MQSGTLDRCIKEINITLWYKNTDKKHTTAMSTYFVAVLQVTALTNNVNVSCPLF